MQTAKQSNDPQVGQLELGTKAKEPPKGGTPNTAELPGLVEYQYGTERWRCSRFKELWEEVLADGHQLADGHHADGHQLADGSQGTASPTSLGLFHDAICGNARGWTLVRRLFGIQPVLPPVGVSFDDLREWGRMELQEAMGLTRAQFQQELDAVRGKWKGIQSSQVPAPIREPAKPPTTTLFAEEDLLAKHGFAMQFGSMEEKTWFAHRVEDYEKILNEKFAAGLARNALITELRLHQIDGWLNVQTTLGGDQWHKMQKLRNDLDKTYQDQVGQLKELCPWAGAVAGKYAFTGVISDITQAIQEYVGKGDARLVDGIFTATEIRVDCRRSVQTSAPRYRAGLVVALNAAKAGLWDPNWKPPFEPPVLKRMDEAWKEAWAKSGEAEGEKVPDLEKDGAEGEYESLNHERKTITP